MKRLEGKVAIVTGGNSGVGAATAALFAQEGAKVVISARRQAQLDEVAEKIRQDGGEVLTMTADISKEEDAKRILADTLDAFGQVDILVNNAGVLESGLKPIDRVDSNDMDRIIDTNTKGTMYCLSEVSAEMARSGHGSIVNVASAAGLVGNGGAAYVASKAAIVGITRHTALRFSGTGIRCNAVCPGTVVTPMVAKMNPANMDPDMFGAMGRHSDLKVPPCQPTDVANIILFLAGDESRSITGQALLCDFGSTL